MLFSAVTVVVVVVVMATSGHSAPDKEELLAGEEHVLVLDTDNFTQALEDNANIMVEFYAPWCGHCKKLRPMYAEAAAALAQEGVAARLAKIDGSDSKNAHLMKKYKTSSFPTLLYFRKDMMEIMKEPLKYDSSRTTADIVRWVTAKSADDMVTFLSRQEGEDGEVDKFLTREDKVTVVARIPEADDDNRKAFISGIVYTSKNPNLSFAIAEPGADNAYKLSLSHPGDVRGVGRRTSHHEADENMNIDVLNSWISVNSFPTVSEFDVALFARLQSAPGAPKYVLHVYATEEKWAEVEQDVISSAGKYRNHVVAVFVNLDDEKLAKMVSELVERDVEEMKPKVSYLVVSHVGNKLRKYMAPGGEDLELNDFIQQVLDKKITAKLKSEKLPADWDSRPVKVLTGENYHQVALDESRDVLLMMYAPWCGHCKRLMPTWDDLAKQYSHDSHVVIAKMDATANEVEDIVVKGFPTIYFYPAKAGAEPLKYSQGGRTLDDLTKFIEQQRVTVGKKDDTKKPAKEEL